MGNTVRRINRPGGIGAPVRPLLGVVVLLVLAPSLILGSSATSSPVVLHDCMLVFRYGDDVRDGVRLSGGEARDINNEGAVVGWSATAAGDIHAMLWRSGVEIDLGTLGGDNSCALGINDRGQVVGWSETQDGERTAVRWDDGVPVDLGRFPGESSVAFAINEAGEAAGMSWPVAVQLAFPLGRAVLWSGDEMIDLNAGVELAGSGAYGVSDHGDVVGWLIPDGGLMTAARWFEGDVELLAADGWERTTAHAVNDSGDVAGWAGQSGDDDVRRAMLWRPGDGAQSLDFGDPLLPVQQWATAWDVNGDGLVVGSSRPEDGDIVAMIWDPAQRSSSALPSLGGARSEAYALNDRIEIVGWALDPAGIPRPVLWAGDEVAVLGGA